MFFAACPLAIKQHVSQLPNVLFDILCQGEITHAGLETAPICIPRKFPEELPSISIAVRGT
jgi:hypothetical protein